MNIFSVTEYLTSALPHSNSLGGEAAFHMPPSTRAGESAATIGGETPKGKLKCSVNRYNSPNFVRDELACCVSQYIRGQMTCSLRNIRLARLMINGSPEANCAIECECERSKVNHTLYKLQRERERERKSTSISTAMQLCHRGTSTSS